MNKNDDIIFKSPRATNKKQQKPKSFEKKFKKVFDRKS